MEVITELLPRDCLERFRPREAAVVPAGVAPYQHVTNMPLAFPVSPAGLRPSINASEIRKPGLPAGARKTQVPPTSERGVGWSGESTSDSCGSARHKGQLGMMSGR
jgi:hypothetical protein